MAEPTPLEEALRLDALEAQKITDTGDDENFNRIVRLACATLSTPVATISFVDSERQWFKRVRAWPRRRRRAVWPSAPIRSRATM